MTKQKASASLLFSSILLSFFLTDSLFARTETLVNLSFENPEGYLLQKRGSIYQYIGSKFKKQDTLIHFEYFRPANKTGNLAKELDERIKRDKNKYTFLNITKPRDARLDKPYSSIFQTSILKPKKGPGKFIGVHFIISDQRNLYYLQAILSSKNLIRPVLDHDIKNFLASFSSSIPVIKPDSLPKQTLYNFFGIQMPIPQQWKSANTWDPWYSFTMSSKIKIGSKNHEYEMMIAASPGTVNDIDSYLQAWITKVLYQEYNTKKSQHFSPFYSFAFKAPDGSEGRTFKTTHYKNGRFHSHLAGHILVRDGVVMIAGAPMSYYKIHRSNHALASRQYDKILNDLRSILIRTKVDLPTKRYSNMENMLIKKGSYDYRYQSSYTTMSSSFFQEKQINWSFFSDHTCSMKMTGFLTSTVDSGSNFDGNPYSGDTISAYLSGKKGFPRTDCRILGKNSRNLWILLTPKKGLAFYFKITPDAHGTYGPFKTKGIAIDDRIEGNYSQGNNYKVYKPYGKK